MLSSWNESESPSYEKVENDSTAIEKVNKSTQTIPSTSPSFLLTVNSLDIKMLKERVCILEKKVEITSNEQKSFPSKVAIKGRFKNAYCIFEEVKGHNSVHCLNTKLDFPQKLDKAKKQNVCLVCLKIANHKEKSCDAKFKTCLICGQNHNTNLHARREVDETFRKRKKESKSD